MKYRGLSSHRMSSKSRKVTIIMTTIGTKTSCTTELAHVTTKLTGALKTQSQTLHYLYHTMVQPRPLTLLQ